MECYAKQDNPERVRYYHAQLKKKFPESKYLPDAAKLIATLGQEPPAQDKPPAKAKPPAKGKDATAPEAWAPEPK